MAQGRKTQEVEDLRKAKLVKAWADMKEGCYHWPDGKERPAGSMNKQEALRFSGYSEKYKGGYLIFDKEWFEKAVDNELRMRRNQRLRTQMPEDEQLKEMFNLVNMEMLHRLQDEPHKISDRDLVAIRKELSTALDEKDPEGKGRKKESRFGMTFDKLIVNLNGVIPDENLKQIRNQFSGRVIEGTLEEDVESVP